ncbi:MAG: DJ-1/PfpI family protein [Tatlockia sp.]|nr:DJ-1/PfpI family protein [Tatlockia sp.]
MKNLGVLLYDNVQSMDFIGLWEVFSIWKNSLNAPLEMFLIAENGSDVHCVNEITIKAHYDFDHSPSIDYLFVPGGPGRMKEVHNEQLITFIKKQAKHAEYILSVCTGMFLLQKAGLFHNTPVTTYWRALQEAQSLPGIQIVEERIVNQGHFWLAGGVSSSIDLAFAFLAQIAGKELAGKVQLLFEYFPKQEVYCTSELIEKLPPYYTAKEGEKAQLPKYIREYLAEHKN